MEADTPDLSALLKTHVSQDNLSTSSVTMWILSTSSIKPLQGSAKHSLTLSTDSQESIPNVFHLHLCLDVWAHTYA